MIKSIISGHIDRKSVFRISILFSISCLYFWSISSDHERAPYVTGDGFEYILMTEAYYNHLSPDIRLEDIVSFKEKYSKVYQWDQFYKKNVIDELIIFIVTSKKQFMENNNWLYYSKDLKLHSYHFSFYSFINLPCYTFFKSKGPIIPFWITNAILVTIACSVILFLSPFSFWQQVLASLCFAISATFWYLKWEHAEILIATLVTVGMVLYFRKNYYPALLVLALSCLQMQPLIVLLGFVAIETAVYYRFNQRNMLLILSLCLISLLPQLFYLINYGTTSLIKDAGYLDRQYITLNRISGFFFDPNDGTILAIPLILIIYIILILRQLFYIIRQRIKYEPDVLIPISIIIMVAIVSMMVMWNHSMAIVNRYVVWVSSIILVHTFYLINKLNNNWAIILSSVCLVAQAYSITFHQKCNNFDWSNHGHSPLAYWMLIHYPKLYDPDPVIFGQRTLHAGLTEEKSPVIFFRNKKVKKVMIHENRLNDLKNLGFSDSLIEVIRKKVIFNFGWGYLDSYYKPGKSDREVYNIIREKRVSEKMSEISNVPSWIEQTIRQTKEWGKTYNEVLRINAEYLLNKDEKFR